MNNQNNVPQKQKTIGSLLITIIITALIAGGGFYVFTKLFQQEEGEKPPVPQSELKNFQGKKLDISFQYPAEWGEPTEEVSNSVTNQPEKGKIYNLSFTYNPYVHIFGASQNTEIGGVGSACPLRGFFKGTDDTGITSCADCEETYQGYCPDPSGPCTDYNECAACQEITISGQPAVSFLSVPSISCTRHGFEKVIFLQTPYNQKDEDFPGLVVEMDLVTFSDVYLHDYALRARTGGPPESEEQKRNKENMEKLFIEIRDERKAEILNNGSKNYLLIRQSDQFENFVESIRFTTKDE